MNTRHAPLPPACAACPLAQRQVPVDVDGRERVIALAGNPNTGKSTVFNALTGLHQHTGNWPGKTVTRAEGSVQFAGVRYRLVDLPGTYSLLTATTDEEVARDFLLFGRPDCTVVVVDATCLERNLNLALQILEITDRVVIALNLMDEAARKGIEVDARRLARLLGVPVVPIVARTGQGLGHLLQTVAAVSGGEVRTAPRRVTGDGPVQTAAAELAALLTGAYPEMPNARWIAMRLLDGDRRVREAVAGGDLAALVTPPLAKGRGPRSPTAPAVPPARVLERADVLRHALGEAFRDQVVAVLFAEAEAIAGRCVRVTGSGRRDFDQILDRLLTAPATGFPIMALGLATVFWLTVAGANYPSQVLARALFWLGERGEAIFVAAGAPWWLTGFVWDGVYRGLAWVVAVMLPPMAIFFPLFTILEDLGFLPRVAFNMDRFFKAAGAHGKQALTMSMGFGCNAAGVIATRVIDSPRERLIAILTNTFVPCNGRFPTLILLASVFVAAGVPAAPASLVAAATVAGVVLVGVAVTLVVSALLSRTVLRGEASSFTLELPPYRRPNLLRTLYTSLIDRTLFVLVRAMKMAAPAGGVIWLLANIDAGNRSVAARIAGALDPVGSLFGLDGAILLAYVVAIPANEIVLPMVLMTYTNAGTLTEAKSLAELRAILVDQQGWTTLTAICLMLFALLHNPCSTTIWTIWAETRSIRWTAVGALLPLTIAFLVTFAVAQGAHLLGW